MQTTQKFHAPEEALPVLSMRQARRMRRYHRILSGDLFADFILPVSRAQVAVALKFLDEKYGRWDRDQWVAAWDYVLPALQKLYPNHTHFGFIAPFGPVRPARTSWVQWLGRHVSKQPGQVAAMAPG